MKYVYWKCKKSAAIGFGNHLLKTIRMPEELVKHNRGRREFPMNTLQA